MYIERSINNYLEYESCQINDEDDPYYKLSIYWELEDEEIIKCLDLIEENLKNGEYSFKLFPKMIRTFSVYSFNNKFKSSNIDTFIVFQSFYNIFFLII